MPDINSLNSNEVSSSFLKPLVADIIKIENLPTFSGQKTDMLIGFSVVGLAKNNLWLMN